MINIEINGKAIKARDGVMVIEAADEAGIPIPRFCYHKKLSIAANCRMCLVDIEKSPKPLPACAIPATDGMKIFTNSPKAIMAQKGVMEFLLINHPLDCPICDQGGECELQDVAMGYGRDIARYAEKKRVVKDEDLGPLIQTDMTRCIQCTRCVRFGQEIAGLMELGVIGRGEYLEIGTYIGKSMVSELSGNVIDLCPVGALTAKPSRYTARSWEMSQHDAVAPHDCIGSNIYLHIRGKQVIRVVARDNEEINETWISDRDRFSYQGLNSAERLHFPLLKKNGVWQETDWQTALEATVQGLRGVIDRHGAEQIGALISPTCTIEEIYLLQRLVRGLGCANIDHRLRQIDFSAEDQAPPFPGLGQAIQDLESLDAALLIGSNVRKEQPIAAHRLRKAALNGARLMFVNPIDYEFHFAVEEKIVAGPMEMLRALAGIAKALLRISGSNSPQSLVTALDDIDLNDTHMAIAKHLLNAGKAAVLLGNLALSHPQLSTLRILARLIAQMSNTKLGYLPEAANSAGAWLAGALPHRRAAGKTLTEPGLDAGAMLEAGLKSYMLMGLEPELDCANPSVALKALKNADFVVTLSAFRSAAMEDYADIMLPITLFAETSGTFVNAEGRWQSFTGAVSPQGEARPGWKVLRVLGNLFDVQGFEYLSSEEVCDELHQATIGIQADNKTGSGDIIPAETLYQRLTPVRDRQVDDPVRIADVPMYAQDSLVRRAGALQQTVDAGQAAVYINETQAARMDLMGARQVMASQGDYSASLPLLIDNRIPDGCVLIPAGLPGTSTLGSSFGLIVLERA